MPTKKWLKTAIVKRNLSGNRSIEHLTWSVIAPAKHAGDQPVSSSSQFCHSIFWEKWWCPRGDRQFSINIAENLMLNFRAWSAMYLLRCALASRIFWSDFCEKYPHFNFGKYQRPW